MEKPQTYYYLSIVSIVLTFTTGMGIFASLVLLVLIQSEKEKLSGNYLVGTEKSLETLKKAKKIVLINLIINGVLFAAVIILFLYVCTQPGRYFGG
ncbi:hypothetical protein [Flavobacterium sp.]|uniref:hypothetical protein n=1 Tax=Flavobacterium sp. TaxID=239 RepID=UPI00286A6CC2|nr:hypothetical protein [Flavobacterium sp.]